MDGGFQYLGDLVIWGFGYLRESGAKLAFSIETRSEFHRKNKSPNAD